LRANLIFCERPAWKSRSKIKKKVTCAKLVKIIPDTPQYMERTPRRFSRCLGSKISVTGRHNILSESYKHCSHASSFVFKFVYLSNYLNAPNNTQWLTNNKWPNVKDKKTSKSKAKIFKFQGKWNNLIVLKLSRRPKTSWSKFNVFCFQE